MDLLEEGNLLLQTLNAPLQVQPGQSGIVDILDEKRGPSTSQSIPRDEVKWKTGSRATRVGLSNSTDEMGH